MRQSAAEPEQGNKRPRASGPELPEDAYEETVEDKDFIDDDGQSHSNEVASWQQLTSSTGTVGVYTSQHRPCLHTLRDTLSVWCVVAAGSQVKVVCRHGLLYAEGALLLGSMSTDSTDHTIDGLCCVLQVCLRTSAMRRTWM